MKLVIQRVSQASVSVDSEVVGSVKKGLFVLVGFKDDDTQEQVRVLAEKLIKLRVMADSEDKMNVTVADAGGSFLVVSQFTLYADTAGGNRPSFGKAARLEIAKPLYEYFINQLKLLGAEVQTGQFGEYMEISTTLDGPVTIIMES